MADDFIRVELTIRASELQKIVGDSYSLASCKGARGDLDPVIALFKNNHVVACRRLSSFFGKKVCYERQKITGLPHDQLINTDPHSPYDFIGCPYFHNP